MSALTMVHTGGDTVVMCATVVLWFLHSHYGL